MSASPVMLQSSSVVGIEGGRVPGIVLTGVVRSSVLLCLRMWKSFIGPCNLLGKGGVAVTGDWLMEGHEERGAPVIVVFVLVLSDQALGGRPA